MNKIREELELLKSWGFETVSIDKVLEMIERADNTEVESAEKSVINIFYPPCIKEEGVDRYFREIPMFTRQAEIYCTGTGVPKSDVWVC